MRHFILAAGFVFGSTALQASAVELNYTWKKGDVHRFRYEDTTKMDMKMAGMAGMGDMPTIRVRSEFSEKVLSVKPDGKADVELTIEKLDVFEGDRSMAALSQVPPAARVVKAELDRKGHARFYRNVTVYVQDDQVYVAVDKAAFSKNGAHVKASGGGAGLGADVEIVASVDPKTGAVTASVTATAKPPAPLKKVEIKEDTPHIDVVPKELLEMMVLPDGDMAEGTSQSMQTPFGKMEDTLSKLNGTVANLQMRLSGKEAGTKTVAVAADEGQEDGEPSMPGMPGGMPSMPGMPGMPGGMPRGVSPMPGHKGQMPGGGSAGAPSTGMQVDADVRFTFDVGAGKLLKLEGTIDTNTSMGGMGSVKVHTTPKLTRL